MCIVPRLCRSRRRCERRRRRPSQRRPRSPRRLACISRSGCCLAWEGLGVSDGWRRCSTGKSIRSSRSTSMLHPCGPLDHTSRTVCRPHPWVLAKGHGWEIRAPRGADCTGCRRTWRPEPTWILAREVLRLSVQPARGVPAHRGAVGEAVRGAACKLPFTMGGASACTLGRATRTGCRPAQGLTGTGQRKGASSWR